MVDLKNSKKTDQKVRRGGGQFMYFVCKVTSLKTWRGTWRGGIRLYYLIKSEIQLLSKHAIRASYDNLFISLLYGWLYKS